MRGKGDVVRVEVVMTVGYVLYCILSLEKCVWITDTSPMEMTWAGGTMLWPLFLEYAGTNDHTSTIAG